MTAPPRSGQGWRESTHRVDRASSSATLPLAMDGLGLSISRASANELEGAFGRFRNLVIARPLLSIHPGSGEKFMTSSEKNPKHHTQRMKNRLQETVTHLRQDIDKVDEPQLAAMFETAAEVLIGLVKAFDDYEKKNEAAWRKSA
jgi:hypothetical protein